MVVDDEPLAKDLIEGYVRQTPFLELAGGYTHAVEALDAMREHPADLLFLDIQMPRLNGLELSKLVGGGTKIVFTTAFEQYALEGFRVDAVDYLLKPVSYAEFLRASDKALRLFELERRPARPPAEPERPRSMVVKSDYKTVQIPLDDILYIEGVKDYVQIHTADGGRTMTLMSMKAVEEYLPASRFVRVHRSFIVNLDRVGTIERNRIVFGRAYIPISDSYKERFAELLAERTPR